VKILKEQRWAVFARFASRRVAPSVRRAIKAPPKPPLQYTPPPKPQKTTTTTTSTTSSSSSSEAPQSTEKPRSSYLPSDWSITTELSLPVDAATRAIKLEKEIRDTENLLYDEIERQEREEREKLQKRSTASPSIPDWKDKEHADEYIKQLSQGQSTESLGERKLVQGKNNLSREARDRYWAVLFFIGINVLVHLISWAPLLKDPLNPGSNQEMETWYQWWKSIAIPSVYTLRHKTLYTDEDGKFHFGLTQWILPHFVHANIFHLGVNMFVFSSFAKALVYRWGTAPLFGVYIGGGIAVSILTVFATQMFNPFGRLSKQELQAKANYYERIYRTVNFRKGETIESKLTPKERKEFKSYKSYFTPGCGSSTSIAALMAINCWAFPYASYKVMGAIDCTGMQLLGGLAVFESIGTLIGGYGLPIGHKEHLAGLVVGTVMYFTWLSKKKALRPSIWDFAKLKKEYVALLEYLRKAYSK